MKNVSVSGIWDNQDRGKVGDYLREHLAPGTTLSVVSAFFTIYAYESLRQELEQIEELRFLFGEPRFILDPDKSTAKAFDVQDAELRLTNRLQQKRIAKDCADWIKRKAKIRSITKANLLHGKMYHCRSPQGVENALLGSSNFTSSGLGYGANANIELNIELNDRRDLADLKAWFEELWDSDLTKDVKQDVLEYLKRIYADTSPEFLYYLTIFHVFDRFLKDQDATQLLEERTGFFETEVWRRLYSFQKDGVKGAINKLLKHNGCIIADSVGLGKTFEALAVIKYFELLNNRVLVLCPKKLRGNWALYRNNDLRNVLARDCFRYDILSHTDLSRNSGTSGDIDLATIHWGNYDLVVIDESHNFRNSAYGKEDEQGRYRPTRYERLMEEVIKKGIPTKVLLLSATPVNNSLKDLRNQIYLITQQRDDALKESAGISHIGNTLKVAQAQFQHWADPKRKEKRKVADLLERLDSSFFKLLDELTIARSRKHILNYYDLSHEKSANGQALGDFPQRRKPISATPPLDLENQFPSYDRLNREISQFKLALYNPSSYVLPQFVDQYDIKQDAQKSLFDEQSSRESFLIGMMKTNLLKRLESSIESFEITLARLLEKIDTTLEKIKAFDNSSQTYEQPDFFDDLEEEELQVLKEQLEVGSKLKFQLAHLNRELWRQDLQEDRDQLITLLNNARAVTAERDGKLQQLKSLIAEKRANPINPGNKKVLVFTAFADTAKYLYDNLKTWATEELDCHIGLIAGGLGDNRTTFAPKGFSRQYDFDAILTNFSPRSKLREKMPDMPQEGEIDILIATDCISEGQNLQDCDTVINYDIHWNPVRIIQRFGRIDRLGSTNKQIQLVNFWPTEDLNQYIKLKERVEARMALVDLAATGEENLLSTEQLRDLIEDDLTYRDQQLLRLKNEILDLEDMDENVNLSEFTLDDFRADLLNYLEANRRQLEEAPLGLYAVVPPPADKGELPGLESEGALRKIALPGVIFCLRHLNGSPELEKVNPLQPFFLVYIRNDGTVRYNFVHAKQILTLFQGLCKGRSRALENLCAAFDASTNQGRQMDVYNELLDKALNAISAHFAKRNFANLFKGRDGKLVGAGKPNKDADEFELVTWLVILDPETAT